MNSQGASKLPIRLAMVLLVSVLSSSAFAQPNPAWGTEHSSVLTLTASDFGSMDDRQVTFTGEFRSCLENSGGPGCYLQAGIPLPSGALIEYMEFAVCDSDADSGAEASLYVLEGLGPSAPPAVSITTQGDGGCSLWTSGYIGLTVDNLSNTYSVRVYLPHQVGVSFRAVRIFYSLQVSPAPAFASFNDVPTSHPFFQYVEALYASGITAGCGGGNFCPNGTVTRGQMAVFLAKALGLHFPN